MKIYPNTNVELTVQLMGTSWLGVLRGAEDDINLVYNGLYNFGASNGELEFSDSSHTTATFWTNKTSMKNFFTNLQFHRKANQGLDSYKGKKGGIWNDCLAYADEQIKELIENSEYFMNFAKEYSYDTYSTGKMTAEKPDNDFKDTVLINAFTEKQ